MEEEIRRIMMGCLKEFFGAQAPTNFKKTLNKKETAEYIGKSTSWIEKNKDVLPPRVSNNPIIYLKDDLDKWLESQKAPKVGNVRNISIRRVK